MIILGLYGAFDWEANKSHNERHKPTWVHDSGATLFINDKHICSISEERLTRIKYEGNFPIKSIEYCLKEGKINYSDIDKIYIPSMCINIFNFQFLDGVIEDRIKNLFPNAEFQVISHHFCHAASSIFTSNFNEGSIVTVDGAGSLMFDFDENPMDYEMSQIGYFNKEKKIFRMFNTIGNRFGSLYQSQSLRIFSNKIGKVISNTDEKYRESVVGKIMGLSSYGRDESLSKTKMYKLSHKNNSHELPHVRFCTDKKKYDLLYSSLSPEKQAYLLQVNFENAMLDYFEKLKECNYLEENICLSGGCFLNIPTNSLLKKSGYNIHIPPCTSDSGLHFGAACYGVYQHFKKVSLPENIALLGKRYSNSEIEEELEGLDYVKYDSFTDLCKFVATKLAKNNIIAWFQNRSEFGPRSLGSRSLLMSASKGENKDIMNTRVKHREYWRPFAGIILEEYLSDYFEEDFMSPYMLYSFNVKEEKISSIPAVTHVDGTCRIQTVSEKYNPEVTELIREYNNLTGIPVIMNTSFNDNGEPIVESPQDAIRSFKNMDIDYLVIGNFVVKK